MEWLDRIVRPMPGQCKKVIIDLISKFEKV
jgi:hypothetical protein